MKCICCNVRAKKGSKISLHCFPNDLALQEKWIRNINSTSSELNNRRPKKSDRICSKHFDSECLENQFTRIILKPGSVPTIFGDQKCGNSPGIKNKLKEENTGLKVTQAQPALVLSSSCNYAMPTSPGSSKSELKKTNSSSLHPSKRCGDERSQGDIIVEDNIIMIVNGPTIADSLKNRPQDNTENDYKYDPLEFTNKLIIERGVKNDHIYASAPEQMMRSLQRNNRLLKVSNSRVKVLEKHVKRLKNKVISLKTVVNDLKREIRSLKDLHELLK